MSDLEQEAFHKIYQRLGFISVEGKPNALHRVCKFHGVCWNGAEDRFPPDDSEWAQVARPWVGNRYTELRLLAVGENLNGYGGLDALCELAEEAKELLSVGWRRVRFHSTYSDYAGSFLWHRLGCYAAAIAEVEGFLAPRWQEDGYPSAQDVARAYDFMAFSEHVKCSPSGSKSKPTASMWEKCGAHVLRPEACLLNPLYLLILGSSDNAYYVGKNVLDFGYEQQQAIGQVQCASAQINGEPVSVLIVPHPQSYGGAANAIVTDVRNAARAQSLRHKPDQQGTKPTC